MISNDSNFEFADCLNSIEARQNSILSNHLLIDRLIGTKCRPHQSNECLRPHTCWHTKNIHWFYRLASSLPMGTHRDKTLTQLRSKHTRILTTLACNFENRKWRQTPKRRGRWRCRHSFCFLFCLRHPVFFAFFRVIFFEFDYKFSVLTKIRAICFESNAEKNRTEKKNR